MEPTAIVVGTTDDTVFGEMERFFNFFFSLQKMSQKLKILCLHGYTQNGTMFSNKTSVVRKDLESLAEFGITF